jgi:hypothetical protein
MSTPLFFPIPRIVPVIDAGSAITLREALASAGAPCRASGRWTERLLVIDPGFEGIEKEPGDWSTVRIGVQANHAARDQARYAVAAMAYGLMDVVARESIRGLAWALPAKPRGRRPSGAALSSAQRQRRYRVRQQGLEGKSDGAKQA